MSIKFKISLSIIALTLVLVSLSLASVQAQKKVQNPYFLFKVPDTWTYMELTNERGSIDVVIMAPAEYGNSLLENSEAKEAGVYSGFARDPDYLLKNSPLDEYVKYKTDRLRDFWNVTSMDNGTISKQKAIKVSSNGINEMANRKRVDYLILNGNDAYTLYYDANVKDFDKYLPEFESMVKSFKFVN